MTVSVTNVLGEQGGGFAAAQARLGPGRIHHCMRALGAAERALAPMVSRVQTRLAFGKAPAEQSAVHERIAESRMVPRTACAVIDRAVQVHLRSIARHELRTPPRFATAAGFASSGAVAAGAPSTDPVTEGPA
jgi:acyl-CoA dehydrogenase